MIPALVLSEKERRQLRGLLCGIRNGAHLSHKDRRFLADLEKRLAPSRICRVKEIELVPKARRARLDADKTAKPLTEIVAVFQPGQRNFYSNAERLIARPTEDRD
jgi:hypothetical protein